MKLTNNFSASAFADGAFWSLVDVARAADTILMDGIVPALRAIDRAIYRAVNWIDKWVTPILIVSAQIALVVWQDLIVWGIDRLHQEFRTPAKPEPKLLPPAPEEIPDIDLPTLPELLAEAAEMTGTQAAAIAAPVAVLTIETEVPESPDALMDLEEMTIRELKALARSRVPGFSKMSKAVLIERLRGAE